MEMQNNWTITYNQEAGAKAGNFLASNIISGVKEEQVIGKIKFKIREDVGATTTEIKFKDVKSNDGKTLVSETDKVIKIKIIEEGKIVVESPTNSVKENKVEETENLSPNKLPQTGENSKIIILGVIGIVVAIIIWEKYKRIHLR